MPHSVMESVKLSGHVVAMPYPSQGHVNPMLSLCKLIASSSSTILITFVVTQEWLGDIASEPKPSNVRFATIPNDVVPLQSQIGADIPAFFRAAVTNMEAPFDNLLRRLQPPATAVIVDVELRFPVAVASRRNIPVALLWTMSASFYLMLHQLGSVALNRPLKVNLLGKVPHATVIN